MKTCRIEEVENVVGSHEAVGRCAAAGVPDERKGEVVRIYVMTRPNHSLHEQELRTWLQPRLARFKMPRDIVFVDDVPLLANGKLDRVAITKMTEEETAA